MPLLPPDPLFRLKGDMGYVQNICFISDSEWTTHLMAATEEGYVYLWDLETNKLLSKQKLGTSIQAIHYVDSYLITQEKSGLVQLCNVEDESSYVPIKRYQCSGGFCRSIVIQDSLILPDVNSTAIALNIETFEKKCVFNPERENIGYLMCLELAEFNEQKYLMGAYETGNVVVWDYMTGKQCNIFKFKEYITSISFDSVIGRGVCGNSSNTLQFFTMKKDASIQLKCEVSMTNEGCSVLGLRHDRKILACGGWDGRLRVFSWKSLRMLVALSQHHKAVTDVKFSRNIVSEVNNKLMAVASADGSITLWNLYNN